MTVYRLNEQQAAFLLTLLKNTPIVVAFKKELVRQFYAMRSLLFEKTTPLWQDTRQMGKEIRQRETDSIKAFIEYAQRQGSKNAQRYYINFSKLADQAAGIKNRELATAMQLNTLQIIERIISVGLHDGITEDRSTRYLSNEKNNYSQLQETILFTIGQNGLPQRIGTTWKRDREYMQDAVLAASAPKREDCKQFLLNLLDKNGGRMKSKEMEEQAKEMGYSQKTIRNAKDDLKSSEAIRYKNEGFGAEKVWIVEKTEFSEPDTFSPENK